MQKSIEQKYLNPLNILNRTKRFFIIFIILVILFCIFQALLPTVAAAGDDAEFNSIEVSATPKIQGMGGEITIYAEANFFGGCCYHLYAYDVAVEVELPEGLKLIGSLPRTISMVDAQPGGQPTTEGFEWEITGTVPGQYELEVTVKTSNCGSMSDTIWIIITDGASISNPDIYPQTPSLDEEISISVEVKSSREEIEVLDTHLYIFATKKEYDVKELAAENETLYLYPKSDGVLGDLEPIASMIGEKLLMAASEFSDKWYSKLSGYSKEIELYLWFVVITSDGKNATSSTYNLQIEDLEQREFNLSAITWGTFIGIIIGIILIFGVWILILRRLERPSGKKGFLNLGGKFYEEPYNAEPSKILALQKRFAARRYFLIIFFIVIGIILLIWALYTGQFGELFDRTLEG